MTEVAVCPGAGSLPIRGGTVPPQLSGGHVSDR